MILEAAKIDTKNVSVATEIDVQSIGLYSVTLMGSSAQILIFHCLKLAIYLSLSLLRNQVENSKHFANLIAVRTRRDKSKSFALIIMKSSHCAFSYYQVNNCRFRCIRRLCQLLRLYSLFCLKFISCHECVRRFCVLWFRIIIARYFNA